MCSIEGEQIKLKAQKINPKITHPRNARTLSGRTIRVYPISLTRSSSSGEIKKAYNPQIASFLENSRLNKGDLIEGKSLWGFSSIPLKSNSINKGGEARTSAHTRQYVIISNICFLQIIEDFAGNIIDIHPQDRILLK